MANIKFTQLPNLTTPTANTIIPVVKSNVNYSVTTENLATFINSNAGNITASGNITGGNIVGNGMYLYSIPGANITGTVTNAAYALVATVADTANAVTGANVSGAVANATYATSAGTAVTATTAATANSVAGANVTGAVGLATLADTANAVSGANVSGAVAQATYAGTANSVAGANVTGTVSNATSADSAGTAQYVTANAQANITSVGLLDFVTVSGNIFTGGDITAIGNITANVGAYFIGDGSQLTGLPASYSNANVVTLMADFGSNSISTTGNITGGYILGNGSQLTGLPALYGNANVVSLLAGFGSNSISTTGTITAGNFVGNGSKLTNLTAANITGTVANATYALNAGSAASANSVSGANVSGAVANATYATSAGTAATATTAATAITVTQASQPSITSVGTLTGLSVSGTTQSGNLYTAGAVSATGNVSAGGFFIGNGSQLTGIVANTTYGNSNVVTLMANFAANNISMTTGTINSANIRGNVYSELTSAITFSASITPAYSSGSVQKFTASSNFTLNAPTGIPTGGSITLIITQDGTGSRVMTPNAAYKFAYGLKTLSTVPGSIDAISIFYDGTNYLCNLVKGYA